MHLTHCHPDLRSYFWPYPYRAFPTAVSADSTYAFRSLALSRGWFLWYLHLWYNNPHCSITAPVTVQRGNQHVRLRIIYETLLLSGGNLQCLGLQSDSRRSSISPHMKEKPLFCGRKIIPIYSHSWNLILTGQEQQDKARQWMTQICPFSWIWSAPIWFF